jgi:peptidoglycan/LPS O-acetylase OafA/YrhL
LVSGICFYCLSEKIELRASWAVAATGILLTASTIHPKIFALLLPAAMPYIFITLVGLIKWPWNTKAGDISYGFYLYSFPVQQIVYTIGAGWSLIAQIITATATVIPLAMLSWHYIEQPAMQWLNKKDSRQTRSLDAGDPGLENSLDARSVSQR